MRSLFQKFRLGADRRLNEEALGRWARGDLPGAEALFRAAVQRNPGHAAALGNLGALLMEMHQYDQGIALLHQAGALDPDDPGILVNLGNAYHFGGQPEAAISYYQRALELEPGHQQARLNILRPLLEICDWRGVAQHEQAVGERHARLGDAAYDGISPFNALFLNYSRTELLAIARRYARTSLTPGGQRMGWGGPGSPVLARHGQRRLKIAYLSSDFHDHPTMHLTQGLYALHDRSRFEVHAYSIGHADTGSNRARVMRDCDRFQEVSALSDQAIAADMRQAGIDLLIDMKGYTGGSRPGILALRPAPIQVNYLGYPGTMGADFMDYVLGDGVVTPPGHEDGYAEEIVRLPHTYQATDDQQPVSTLPVGRQAANLPDDAFVFCCFNNSAKIDRASFSAWMAIMREVPGAVLWLLETSGFTKANLASAAREGGVDPARLLYAPILEKAQHLARLRLADLALDTFIYNSHTTATDALWAGVPLITVMGETFASRVAASVLTAVGLSSLVAASRADFVRCAVQVAHDPVRLAHLRSTLARRETAPLFSTRAYVSDLEQAFLHMHERSLSRSSPRVGSSPSSGG